MNKSATSNSIATLKVRITTTTRGWAGADYLDQTSPNKKSNRQGTCLMPRNKELLQHQPPEMFSRQALEVTFRLLRNNNSDLAFALKKTMDHIQFAPSEAVVGTHSGEMHLNTELLKLLQANTIVKIVAAVNDIGQQAVDRKDLPQQQIKTLHDLIEDWAELAEWILKHATSEKNAYS